MRKKGIAKDLRFLEVSLVKSPACAEARIEVLNKLLNGSYKLENKKEDNNLTEVPKETKPETKTEDVNPMAQLAEAIVKFSQKIDEVLSKIDKLSETITKGQETPEPEPAEPKEEPTNPVEPTEPAEAKPTEPVSEEVKKELTEQKKVIEEQKKALEKLSKTLEEIKNEPVHTPVTTTEKKPITPDVADSKMMEFLQKRGN